MVVLGTPFWIDAGDVFIGAAVDPAIVGQVGALAAAAGPAVTAAAQAAKQRLAFRQAPAGVSRCAAVPRSGRRCRLLRCGREPDRGVDGAIGAGPVPPANDTGPAQQTAPSTAQRYHKLAGADRLTGLALFSGSATAPDS